MVHSASMIAKRISSQDELDEAFICYWKLDDGIWLIYIPDCGCGQLTNHEVVEHEDRTITVSPSILMYGHLGGSPSTRHGFLEHGEWREV
jgi:hypothetical protein